MSDWSKYRILQIFSFIWLVIIILYLVGCVQSLMTYTPTFYNYQEKIIVGGQEIVPLKIYKKDNNVVLDIDVITNQEDTDNVKKHYNTTNEPLMETYKKKEITSPIYYQIYTSNDVYAKNKTEQNTNFNFYKTLKINDGYLRSGDNNIIDLSLENNQNLNKYIYIYLFDNLKINAWNSDIKPTQIIQFDSKYLLDYVDVSNYINELNYLKTNNEIIKKYEKWIYYNELNERLISTYFSTKQTNINASFIQKLKTINKNNVLEVIDYLILNNQKFLQKYKEILSITNGNGIYVIDKKLEEYSPIKINNLIFYLKNMEVYKTVINDRINTEYEKIIKENEQNLNDKNEKYKKYLDLKEGLSIEQKYNYLLYLINNK